MVMRVQICNKCGQEFGEGGNLCAECFYLANPVRYDLPLKQRIDVERQEWLVDRYMTTPKYNVHKMEWL